MKLLELTPEEHAWLAAPLQAGEPLAERLGRALADTLGARLRCAVRLEPVPASPPSIAPEAPVWRIDETLATLWLVRRLGGRYTVGRAPFVSAGLLAALDTVLAERWLDQVDVAHVPDAFTWRVVTDTVTATLGLELPRDARALTAWAQRISAGRAA